MEIKRHADSPKKNPNLYWCLIAGAGNFPEKKEKFNYKTAFVFVSGVGDHFEPAAVRAGGERAGRRAHPGCQRIRQRAQQLQQRVRRRPAAGEAIF